MSEHGGFLQGILDNPDDNDVRLIYADWLDERGDPRAEFIRLQIELAKYAPGRRPSELTLRERELTQAHGRAWAGPLTELVRSWNFHRGFIDQVAIRTQDFVAVIEQVVRLAPIKHLTLEYDSQSALPAQFGADATVFGTEPPLAHLESLTLAGNSLNDWDLQTFSVWTSLDRLTELDLSQNRIGNVGVKSLAHADVFARLVTLNLSDNTISLEGIRALESALVAYRERGQIPHLETVDLRGNPLTTPARQELQRTRYLKHIAAVDPPRLLGAPARRG